MMLYDWILFTLALVGVCDCNIERYTGQGILGHAADLIANRGRRAADR